MLTYDRLLQIITLEVTNDQQGVNTYYTVRTRVLETDTNIQYGETKDVVVAVVETETDPAIVEAAQALRDAIIAHEVAKDPNGTIATLEQQAKTLRTASPLPAVPATLSP